MPNLAPLIDISYYQTTMEASLRLYYSDQNPSYDFLFAGLSRTDILSERDETIIETEMRSILMIIARLEAAFIIDCKARANSKSADPLSVDLRNLHKKLRKRRNRVRLDEDILKIWKNHLDPTGRAVVGQLRGMLKYRHWLAHGRYWQFGAKHSYNDVYLVADVILTGFGLQV